MDENSSFFFAVFFAPLRLCANHFIKNLHRRNPKNAFTQFFWPKRGLR